MALILVGCGSSKDQSFSRLPYETEHDIESDIYNYRIKNDSIKITTDFYKVVVLSDPKKKVFLLDEDKVFDLRVINFGMKELYLPEWFDIGGDEKYELCIKLFKKGKKAFEPYEQKRVVTTTSIHRSSTMDRKVLHSEKGKSINYSNLPIDRSLKVVDTGKYLAKIYIDLSNFGYFKILETDFFFEVVNN